LTTSMPVPSFHPEAGPESHSHSPRRSAVKMRGGGMQGGQMPLLPGTTSTQAPSANPQPIWRETTSSGSSCPDPFTDAAAYREWLSTFGLGNTQHQTHQHLTLGPTPLWSTGFGRANHSYMTTDTTMVDYCPSVHDPSMAMHLSGSSLDDGIDQGMSMHLSGPSLNDDFGTQFLKAPTNTPATAAESVGERCSGISPLPITPHFDVLRSK
jgi:hypothetical protein